MSNEIYSSLKNIVNIHGVIKQTFAPVAK